jgi:hypothetical protein
MMRTPTNAIRVATLFSVLCAGSALGADKPPCDLLTREQAATVVGAGAIGTQYVLEDLPQRRAGAKELTAIHTCGWFIKETQSAVEVHLVAAPLDEQGMSFALTTLGTHGKRRQSDEQEFGNVSCWAEQAQKPQFPFAACVGNVKGNALKVLFRSNSATPTIQQAKFLFDQAAAGL